MDITLHERLARVETRLDGIERQQGEMASDLRLVRDHVVAVSAGKGAHTRITAIVIAFLTLVAGLWETYFRKFHG